MADFDWSPFEGDKMVFEHIGDELIGEITHLAVGTGQRGEYPILKVRNREGAEKEVSAPTDLARKLAEIKPQVGDQIAMKLVELKNTGQPSPMKVFAVRHKASENGHAEPDPDEFSDEPF